MKRAGKTKRREIAAALKDAILRGRLKPGARLVELQLGSEYGVSQACIREALQELESLGLIVKYPNRGSFVINLRAEDLVQIHRVRRELEALACAMAATVPNPELLQVLEDCINEMRAGAERRDYQTYLNADYRFHTSIWRQQPNRYLERALQAVCLPLFAGDLVRRSPTAHIDFGRAIRRHQLILSVLRTGDSALVTKVVRRLMDKFLRADLTDYAQINASTTREGPEAQESPAVSPSTR